ncbi:MAG: hypothetical protein ACE145_07155 [Terriglobia bacterium]
MQRILLVGISLLLICGRELARPADLDLTQRYLLLATTKTSTMQKELDRASSAGYRIVGSSPTGGSEMVAILEKISTPPRTYQYFLLATSRTSTMQKELNEAAERGFRLMPKTIIAKEQVLGGVEIVSLMEKAPNSSQHYRYLLLATSRTSTMQKELAQAAEDGYEIIGMVSRGEHIVILEKPAPAQ